MMNKRIGHFKKYVSTITIFFLITTPLLTSCNGGGDGISTNNKIEDILAIQNENAETYFKTIEDIIDNNRSVESEVNDHDPNTILKLDALLENRANLFEKLNDLNDDIIINEEDLQNYLKSSNNNTIDINSINAVGVLAVCLGALAVGAFTAGIVGSMEKADEEYRKCYATYLESASKNDISKESAFENYKYCRSKVRSDEKDSMFFAAGGLMFSAWGPDLAGSYNSGRVALTAISTALDTSGVYTYFKERNSSSPRMGIGQTDSRGEVVVPEGNWDVVLFKKGYARSGLEEGDSLTVFTSETVKINFSPVQVDDITSGNCGNDNGGNIIDIDDDCTSPPCNGKTISGDFAVTCNDDYTDGGLFSVTIADDGSVTGEWDGGDLTGGVYLGWLSLTIKGDLENAGCVMGGYLKGSGANLSGSGMVVCDDGNCYGEWSTSH